MDIREQYTHKRQFMTPLNIMLDYGGHLNILLDYEEPLNIVLDYGGRWVQKVENNRFKAINRECLSCFVFTS